MWLDLTDIGDQSAPVVAVAFFNDKILRFDDWRIRSDGSLMINANLDRFKESWFGFTVLVRTDLTDSEIRDFVDLAIKQTK